MIAAPPEVERWLDEYRRVKADRAADPTWLAELRAAAIERFEALGFPTQRDEEWKYTSVAPIAGTAFRRAAVSHATPGDVADAIGDARVRLVFVDGAYQPDLSLVDGLPAGVTVCNLGEALAREPATMERHLGRYARFDRNAFVALNTALVDDAAFVHVPRGVVIEEPIHVLYLSNAGDDPTESQVRALFVVDEHSQATVVETFASRVPGSVSLTCAVSEIVLAQNAVFDHYKVERESERAYHVATQQTDQQRASVFSSHNITLGGALVRNDIQARLGGEGAEATVNGLYAPRGRQHVDNHTAIDHAMPHCNSHELYKGIMDDRSTGVFNGKIFVRQDAQKTDAKQTNQNLLLSPDAVIDTKPQLEIFADDVRCTHGATVGQLDAEALFYLRSRGIGEREARGLLVHAFAGDLLNRIKVARLRERLERLLQERLAAA